MANLVATISESVTINGALRGSTNTLTVADITDTFERTVTCPHSNTTTIASFNSSVAGSAGNMNLGASRTIAERCRNKYTICQGSANNYRCKTEISQRNRRSGNSTGFTRNPEYARTHQNSNYGGISRKRA